ncbi:MAG TPA: CocE/NonD family hydrolase [Chthonomonadaceae bacterium]|nr:CocE/NonD family hydrolase [Chthonomonadaceae bacterium]
MISASRHHYLVLWLLSSAFLLRVLGQILVVFLHVSFLPPAEEWYSGLMPYGPLLVSQILILALMVKINLNFTRGTGLFFRPHRRFGIGLAIFAAIYFAIMVIRYAVTMSLYPRERWTGGSIPTFFHWVLAGYLLVIALHHWKYGQPSARSKHPSLLARFATATARVVGVCILIAGLTGWAGYLLLPTIIARYLHMRGPQYAVRIDRNVPLTTTDGIRLVSDIYHPRRAGRATPTILVRIPYSRTFTNTLFATVLGRLWAERGYTVVIQGTRGRYQSGGVYDPLRHERADGIDTLNWIARQPWYDGRIGMWGGSYFGYTQWAIADRRNPGPTALMIQEASTDFHGMFYPGGAFSLWSALEWAVMSHGRVDVPPTPQKLGKGFDGFPLIQADERAECEIPFFDDWALRSIMQ